MKLKDCPQRRVEWVAGMISRKNMQLLLGVVWLLDGLLQLKPKMFTSAFVDNVILPVGQGQPEWVASLVRWGANLAIQHIAAWNAMFAAVQILIGVLLVVNYRAKAAITASILWSAIVWVFGEGLGQILSGQSLLLTGAPGAVLIYALIGVAIWPRSDGHASEWNTSGIRFAQLSLAALFVLGFLLHLQSSYLTPTGLSRAITVAWLAVAIGHHGMMASVLLGLVELIIAAMLIWKVRLPLAVFVSIMLSMAFWDVGQSFGEVFSPVSTDFNSGLLMMILALCAYPRWPLHLRRFFEMRNREFQV